MVLNFRERRHDLFLDENLSIYDLVNGNTAYLDDYLKIYTDYLPHYARYLPVMRQRAEKQIKIQSLERWHQWLVLYEDKPAAMIGFLYNRVRNLGILMDFAVVEEYRGLEIPGADRFAGRLLYLAMDQLKKDAAEIGNPLPLCMAAEVEHRPLVERYKEYGFIEFQVEYFEPPSTPELLDLAPSVDFEGVGFSRLHLGAFPMPGSDFQPTRDWVVDIILRALLEDHYRLPENHWLFELISNSIQLGVSLP